MRRETKIKVGIAAYVVVMAIVSVWASKQQKKAQEKFAQDIADRIKAAMSKEHKKP